MGLPCPALPKSDAKLNLKRGPISEASPVRFIRYHRLPHWDNHQEYRIYPSIYTGFVL